MSFIHSFYKYILIEAISWHGIYTGSLSKERPYGRSKTVQLYIDYSNSDNNSNNKTDPEEENHIPIQVLVLLFENINSSTSFFGMA